MRKELLMKVRKIFNHLVFISRTIGQCRSNVITRSVKVQLTKFIGSNMGQPINDFEARYPRQIQSMSHINIWRYHSQLRLWHSNDFNTLIDVLLDTHVPGLWNGIKRATYRDVFDSILNLPWPGDVFLIGGVIRDCLRREIPNDVDISVSCPPSDLRIMCEAKGWHFMSTGDYFMIGDRKANEYLEGKDIYAQLGPLYKGEFSMNAVVYDVRNRLLIDRSGYGIDDSIQKRIRIVEPSPKIWHWWMDAGKIFRLYKFLMRGYSAFDDQVTFILENTPRVFCEKTMHKRCQTLFKRLHCSKDHLKSLIIKDIERLFSNKEQKKTLISWYLRFLDTICIV